MNITLDVHAKTLLALSTLTGDASRPVPMQGVNIRRKPDSSAVELHATNGHCVGRVILDAPGEPFDVTLMVHDYMTVLKAAAKAEKRMPEIAREVSLTIDTDAKTCAMNNAYTGLSLSRPLADDDFPTIDQVWPTADRIAPLESIGFTPVMLKTIAGFFDALPVQSVAVKFSFTRSSFSNAGDPGDAESVVLVEGYNAKIIIMPARIE